MLQLVSMRIRKLLHLKHFSCKRNKIIKASSLEKLKSQFSWRYIYRNAPLKKKKGREKGHTIYIETGQKMLQVQRCSLDCTAPQKQHLYLLLIVYIDTSCPPWLLYKKFF